MIEITDPADGGAALQQAAAVVGRVRLGRVDIRERRSSSARRHHRRSRRSVRARVAAIGPGTAATLRAGAHRRRSAARSVRRRGSRRGLSSHRLPPAVASCSYGRRWPATSCPTGCVTRAGRSMSSMPTERSDARSTRTQRRAVAAADIVTFTSSSTVEHFVASLRCRRCAARGGLHRARDGRDGDEARLARRCHCERSTASSGLVDELVRFVDR